MKFGFFVDPDRTRYCYLRLRRLKTAIADSSVLDALLARLEVPAAPESAGLSERSKVATKMMAIEQQIDRLRAPKTSLWHDVSAPEVLAASLFAVSKHAEGPLSELFSRADDAKALAPPTASWLDSIGLTLYNRLPPGTAFDLVGYHKAAFSGLRVVGVAIKNDASEIDHALEAMTSFARYLHATQVACTPAVAAAYLSAHAEATGRWDSEALTRRLQSFGIGLLMVEGDAVSQALLPKTRAIDGESLTALMAAFGARA